MFRAGGLLPYRMTPAGAQFLLLRETRYNKEVMHVAGGRVEPSDRDIRATIAREFVEEVGAWPADLEARVRSAPLTCPTAGYCLATIDVGDVREAPPAHTHWVDARGEAPVPLSWLAARCIVDTSRDVERNVGLAAHRRHRSCVDRRVLSVRAACA